MHISQRLAKIQYDFDDGLYHLIAERENPEATQEEIDMIAESLMDNDIWITETHPPEEW